jgi:hypothetical protein
VTVSPRADKARPRTFDLVDFEARPHAFARSCASVLGF